MIQEAKASCRKLEIKIIFLIKRRMEKNIFLTWVTRNSRISERMIKYKISRWDPIIFELERRKFIFDSLKEKLNDEQIKYYALNVLSDHVHLVCTCDIQKISLLIQNLKWYSSFMFSKKYNFSKKGKWKQTKIWAQWYSITYLNTQNHLDKAIEYTISNHDKHKLENIL